MGIVAGGGEGSWDLAVCREGKPSRSVGVGLRGGGVQESRKNHSIRGS